MADLRADIQNALTYIEENLTEELEIRDIAKKAFLSPFYFQRIFGVMCGISVGEYIRGRRLSLAGEELARSDAKVIDNKGDVVTTSSHICGESGANIALVLSAVNTAPLIYGILLGHCFLQLRIVL